MDQVKKDVLKVCSKLQDYLKEHSNDIESIIVIAASKGGMLSTIAGDTDRHAQAFAFLREKQPETWEYIEQLRNKAKEYVSNPFENVQSSEDFLEFLGKATKDATDEDLEALKSMVCQMFEVAEMPVPVSIQSAANPDFLLLATIENKGLLSEAFEAVQNES